MAAKERIDRNTDGKTGKSDSTGAMWWKRFMKEGLSKVPNDDNGSSETPQNKNCLLRLTTR